MKKISMLGIAAVLVAFVAIGVARQSSSSQSTPTGKSLIQKVADINLTEVELGKLAEQKGNDAAVKDFGRRMVQDHTQAENDLQQLAKREGVTLPTQPGSEASSLQQQLSATSGAQFDHLYIQHMLSGHKDAIAALESDVEHENNPAIKAYMEKTLPVIQDHIRIAEDIAGKMGMPGKEGLQQPDKAITASPTPK